MTLKLRREDRRVAVIADVFRELLCRSIGLPAIRPTFTLALAGLRLAKQARVPFVTCPLPAKRYEHEADRQDLADSEKGEVRNGWQLDHASPQEAVAWPDRYCPSRRPLVPASASFIKPARFTPSFVRTKPGGIVRCNRQEELVMVDGTSGAARATKVDSKPTENQKETNGQEGRHRHQKVEVAAKRTKNGTVNAKPVDVQARRENNVDGRKLKVKTYPSQHDTEKSAQGRMNVKVVQTTVKNGAPKRRKKRQTDVDALRAEETKSNENRLINAAPQRSDKARQGKENGKVVPTLANNSTATAAKSEQAEETDQKELDLLLERLKADAGEEVDLNSKFIKEFPKDWLAQAAGNPKKSKALLKYALDLEFKELRFRVGYLEKLKGEIAKAVKKAETQERSDGKVNNIDAVTMKERLTAQIEKIDAAIDEIKRQVELYDKRSHFDMLKTVVPLMRKAKNEATESYEEAELLVEFNEFPARYRDLSKLRTLIMNDALNKKKQRHLGKLSPRDEAIESMKAELQEIDRQVQEYRNQSDFETLRKVIPLMREAAEKALEIGVKASV